MEERERRSVRDVLNQYMKMQMPEINDTIRFAQPFILDDVSVKLGPWSGYNVLAQNPVYPIS